MLSVFRQLPAFLPLASLRDGKTFQKRSVSSPAPVTMVLPSGLIARQSTRQVWPVKVATFSILGYFHTLISLCEYPWVLTISLCVLLNIRLHTCDPTSIVLNVSPVRVLRNLIVLSAVPPPDTRSPCWCGDHATALTAARWSANLRTGSLEWLFQTQSLLSLPPEQSCCSSKDHFSPQTSCLWLASLLMKGVLDRRSRCRMVLSREPVLSNEELQAIAPTLFECPPKVLIFFILTISQMWTSPLLVPTEKSGPFCDHATEVVESDTPKSHNLLTLELLAFQRYTLEESPTARKFWEDQSMRLRQQSSWRAGASSTLTGNLLTLRFLAPFSASSRKSQLFLSVCGESSVLSSLLLYLRILLFSQQSMLSSCCFCGDSSITYRLQRSINRVPQPSVLQFSLSSSIQESSDLNSESRLRHFLAGMYRSVMADAASGEPSSGWEVGLSASKAEMRSE